MKTALAFLFIFFTTSVFADTTYSYRNNDYEITHRILPDYQQITFNGSVMPFDSKQGLDTVQERLVKGLDILLVIQQSPGGYEHSFRKLGKALRKACHQKHGPYCQVTAYVEDKCASACIELFMFGDNRIASRQSRFGFHRKFFLTSNLTVVSSEQMARKYIAHGANADWLMAHLNIFTDDQKYGTWVMSTALIEANIVTGIADSFEMFLSAYR